MKTGIKKDEEEKGNRIKLKMAHDALLLTKFSHHTGDGWPALFATPRKQVLPDQIHYGNVKRNKTLKAKQHTSTATFFYSLKN